MTRPPSFVSRLGLSGTDLRRLRELRALVRVESVRLPQALLRELVTLLEDARPWRVPRVPIPEMTRGEMLRAVRWRLGTVPPGGAEAAAAFVTRHRQRRKPSLPAPEAGARRRPR